MALLANVFKEGLCDGRGGVEGQRLTQVRSLYVLYHAVLTTVYPGGYHTVSPTYRQRS